MRRFIFSILFASVFAFGQSRPEFEVASIKPASQQVEQVGVGMHIDGSQVSFSAISVKELVFMAYRVKPNQISGPDWVANQRYNIAAKVPDGVSQDQVPAMLQTLLADRFQMKMHHETKEFPVYALGIAKTGLKLTAQPADPESDGKTSVPLNVAAGGNANGVAINLGNGSSMTLGTTTLEVKKLNMPRFVDLLSRFTDRPVVDMTNLKGAYDFTLDLTPEDRTVMLIRSAVSAGVVLPPQALRLLDTGSTVSLTSSLEKFGFTFEARRAPLDTIVIDSIQKNPTEN